MLKIQVDGCLKVINIELGPKGEDKSIMVEIENYSLEEINGVTSICINKIKSDRPMYNIALQSFVSGKSYEIPEDIALWLKLFL